MHPSCVDVLTQENVLGFAFYDVVALSLCYC